MPPREAEAEEAEGAEHDEHDTTKEAGGTQRARCEESTTFQITDTVLRNNELRNTLYTRAKNILYAKIAAHNPQTTIV